MTHYEGTGTEILDQCDGKLDYIFIGAGTGGSITGVGRKLKENLPNVKVIGVDPYGSKMAYPPSLNTNMEGGFSEKGIGQAFIPKVIDRSLVDEWRKVWDKESFEWARRLH